MKVSEARTHYGVILTTLRAERDKRMKYLGEPRRSQAVAEIDRAIASLEALGELFGAAAAAGVLATDIEQQPLIDVPPAKPYQ